MPGPLVHAGARCPLRGRRLTTGQGMKARSSGRGPPCETMPGAPARRAPGRRAGNREDRRRFCRNRNLDLGGLHREAGMGGEESPGSVRDSSLLLNLGEVQLQHTAFCAPGRGGRGHAGVMGSCSSVTHLSGSSGHSRVSSRTCPLLRWPFSSIHRARVWMVVHRPAVHDRGRLRDLGQVGDGEAVGAAGVLIDREGGVDDHLVAVRSVLVVRGGRACRGQSCPAEPFAQLAV